MDQSERGLSRERVVIVGAGLTGLAAAHRLVSRASSIRRPVDVVVLEANHRVGGSIWTDRSAGFTLEGGGRLVHHEQALGPGPLPRPGPWRSDYRD